MSTWKINPTTGDYLIVNGAPVPSDDLIYPAYYRIRIPRLQWMYAPDNKYGSDLNTIQKNTGNAAIAMINNALQPMVDDGRALGVDTEFNATQPSSRNEIAVEVSITDALGVDTTLSLPSLGN